MMWPVSRCSRPPQGLQAFYPQPPGGVRIGNADRAVRVLVPGTAGVPYGQKQIFYTYDKQNVNYALAKENTTYNGYVVDEDVEIERTARTSMGSGSREYRHHDR